MAIISIVNVDLNIYVVVYEGVYERVYENVYSDDYSLSLRNRTSLPTQLNLSLLNQRDC